MTLTIGDWLIYVTVFFGIFTSFFFLFTLLDEWTRERKTRRIKYEKVCIIVPCYNEERTVGATIESILALEYPKHLLEIIVVDDGSTDGTYHIAKQYATRGVTVYRKKNGGKYTALNHALKRTDAVYVGALDADSFVDPQALKKIMQYFSDKNVMAVTPSMKVNTPKHWLQKIQWTEYLLGIFLRKVFALLGAIHVTPGPFSIYRREFFLKHGFYREAYHTEDIEVALRMQSFNYEIENAHDAYVYTNGPADFRTLWNQRLRWYNGFLRNVEEYRELFSKKHGILGFFILPASFFSVGLVILGIAYTLYRLFTGAWNQYVYLRATGFDFFQWNWSFDAFFLNLSSTAILGWIAILIGIVVILAAKNVAGEKQSIIERYVWFLVAYWFLFGLWWIAALYARYTGKKVGWGHKSVTEKTLSK